ncbi:hypothetical protein Bca101_053532 [Brassica carinata]
MVIVEVISRFDTTTLILLYNTPESPLHGLIIVNRLYKKNFCITAAYRPVRELIKHECLKDQERKKREEAEKSSEEGSEAKEEATEERVITLRVLSMEDMRIAKSQVAASFAAEGAGMNELKQWNELYGEGGSSKKEQLSYFL